jgi:NAD(P)-dependent dehydrogenase (short-subunit alcohol dehydrogenase family)
MTKIWFITGSSRGLGRSLTEAVLANGDKVSATARNLAQLKELVEQYPNQILAVQLDVTDNDQVRSAVEQTVKHFGRIDVLVNNAGFGTIGAAEAYTEVQVRNQLETNLYAPIAITRAVLPIMRRQRSGRILQISSIGGRVGNAGLTIYQAAKFGLGGFSEALAKEVAPVGIKVTSVEPGGFRTDWMSTASTDFPPEIEGYEKTVGARKALFTSDKFIPMGDPDKAAQVMIELAEHPEPPVHLVLGSEAIGMIRQANALTNEEMEKWLPVSFSTNADDAQNPLETEMGKALFAAKK